MRAASSLDWPEAMATRNRRRSARCATGGRPGDRNARRPARSDRRFCFLVIAHLACQVLRGSIESTLHAAIAVMHQLISARQRPFTGGLFERVKCEIAAQ